MDEPVEENSRDDDPRRFAILASIKKMKRYGDANPFDADESFCLPVESLSRPSLATKKHSSRWPIGCFGLILAVVLHPTVPLVFPEVLATGSNFLIYSLVMIAFYMLLLVIISVSNYRTMREGGVPTSLNSLRVPQCVAEIGVDVRSTLQTHITDLTEKGIADGTPKFRIQICDRGLIVFDHERMRISVEGFGAICQLRPRDVISLEEYNVLHRLSFDYYMIDLGFVATFRIDAATDLALAVSASEKTTVHSRDSSHPPLPPTIVPNPLYENAVHALGLGSVPKSEARVVALESSKSLQPTGTIPWSQTVLHSAIQASVDKIGQSSDTSASRGEPSVCLPIDTVLPASRIVNFYRYTGLFISMILLTSGIMSFELVRKGGVRFLPIASVIFLGSVVATMLAVGGYYRIQDVAFRRLLLERATRNSNRLHSLPYRLVYLEFTCTGQLIEVLHPTRRDLEQTAERGLLFFDCDNGQLIIEGMDVRFHILSQDVERLRDLSEACDGGFEMQFRVGTIERVTIQAYQILGFQSIRVTFRRCLGISRRNRLLELTEQALGQQADSVGAE